MIIRCVCTKKLCTITKPQNRLNLNLFCDQVALYFNMTAQKQVRHLKELNSVYRR